MTEQNTSLRIITVRPDAEVMTKQHLPNFIGISSATAGSTGIGMNLVIIPPGGAAEPHVHIGSETAIYLISGNVETKFGAGLRESVINQSGDFIYIPAGLPHQPVNLSSTDPAVAVVARNDPDEQESVQHYDPNA
jgi:uncharacterized RmlC-like cupin family protein